MRIFVTAKPKSKQEKIEKLDDSHYRIFVKEPPVNGAANKAITDALALYFHVPKSFVSIVSGYFSKQKVIEIII